MKNSGLNLCFFLVLAGVGADSAGFRENIPDASPSDSYAQRLKVTHAYIIHTTS